MSVSIWQDSSCWPDERDRLRDSAEICIVGGGIVGAATAAFLSNRGREVIVLEAGMVGSGATGKCAGHCVTEMRHNYHLVAENIGREKAREYRRQLRGAVECLKAWAQQLGVPYESNGSQCLAVDESGSQRLSQSAVALQADGFEVEFSGAAFSGGDFQGRLYQPYDLSIQPLILTRRLMESSKAQVYENAEVYAIEQGDHVTVRSNRVIVTCDQVILATDAYSRLLHSYFHDKVQPVRGQMLITKPIVGPRFIDMPTAMEDGTAYFRQLQDGRLLIGGRGGLSADIEITLADETTSEIQSAIEQWIKRHLPELGVFEVEHRWAGVMGFTRDYLPIIGRLPGMSRVAFVVGCNGGGLSKSPILAQAVVELVLDSKEPPSVLDARRFG